MAAKAATSRKTLRARARQEGFFRSPAWTCADGTGGNASDRHRVTMRLLASAKTVGSDESSSVVEFARWRRPRRSESKLRPGRTTRSSWISPWLLRSSRGRPTRRGRPGTALAACLSHGRRADARRRCGDRRAGRRTGRCRADASGCGSWLSPARPCSPLDAADVLAPALAAHARRRARDSVRDVDRRHDARDGPRLSSKRTSPRADEAARLWAFATVYLVGGRALLSWSEVGARRRGEMLKPTLIVGAGRVGRLTARRLRRIPSSGFSPVGFLDKDPIDTVDDESAPPVLGASWDLEQRRPRARASSRSSSRSRRPRTRSCSALPVDARSWASASRSCRGSSIG